MTPEQWKEIERIYMDALDKPGGEREGFVRAESRGDEDVFEEVMRLLRTEPPGSDFMESPGAAALAQMPSIPRRLGEFELLEEVGRGAMGVVYRAIQQPLGRVVAVKVLPPSPAITQNRVDRFVREARAAGKLSHPHIVPVLTVGDEGGIRYFAMEYVEGHNLAVELKALHRSLVSKDEPPAHLPDSRSQEYFRSVVRLVRDAAGALAYAHAQGIVHRDLKPSNLQLDKAGSIHVVDFGLAHDEGQETLTKSGDVAGTPHYMSPEQARALRHLVDHRTDIYSLGVVLYELLTLNRPFRGHSSTEILNNILQTEAPRIRRVNPRVPRDLEVICDKAMAKDPAHRYSSAAELREDLERFLTHQAIQAQPPSPLQRLARFTRRRGRALAATSAVLLALVLGAWWSARTVRQRRIDTDREVVIAALEAESLEDLPLSEQLDLRRRLQSLREEVGVRAADGEDPITELERAFEEYKLDLRRSGLEDLAASRDRALSAGARELRRLSGLQTLLLVSHLFPEDGELKELASIEAAFPTISVRALDQQGRVTPADVLVRSIDPFTTECGESRLIGRTPLDRSPIQPGDYRIVVEFDAGGLRELVCSPGPATMDVELVANRRADEEEITVGMVAYPAARYTFSDYPGEPCFQGKSVRLESFMLDVAEVSNAEFYAFMQATGSPAPKFWGLFVEDDATFLRDYGERPVVSVTWPEAVAYAEWVGKRLPTMGEWHRAAGGLDNWPFPYSADSAAEVLGNVHAPQRPGDGQQRWRNYLEFTVPVRSRADAGTPEGVLHMYGNVMEWTESTAVSLSPDGELVPRAYQRFMTGGAWDALARGEGMKNPAVWGTGPNYTIPDLGFRCAKSAAP